MDTVATSYYNPNSLPSGFPGKLPLSELGGSITDSGSKSYAFTIFPSYSTMITPVAMGKAVETSGVKTKSGIDGGSSTSGIGTNTAAVSQTSKPSSATAIVVRWTFLFGIAFLTVL